MLFKLIFNSSSVYFLSLEHSVFPMNGVSMLFNLLYFLNCRHCVHIETSVVSNWLHLKLFHLQSSVVHELFIVYFSICLGPLHFLWIVFGFEVNMALRSAKSENLTVISHKGNSMAGINRRTTKITFIYSHL